MKEVYIIQKGIRYSVDQDRVEEQHSRMISYQNQEYYIFCCDRQDECAGKCRQKRIHRYLRRSRIRRIMPDEMEGMRKNQRVRIRRSGLRIIIFSSQSASCEKLTTKMIFNKNVG